jgi:5'-methylthioadenosine phosphorylase
MVSQTSGPEIILAGELEISCALLGFGIDYANGVTETPTPVEVLDENLKKSKDVFTRILRSFVKNYRKSRFQGFVYRFK